MKASDNGPLALRALAVTVSALLGTVIAFILVSGIEALFKGRGMDLFGAVWNPSAGKFGILAMIHGTLLLALSSLALGFLLSLGCCCMLNGLAPQPVASALMLLLTVMTAMPTVVYGFAAVFLLVPLIRSALGGTGFCWLAAALLLALQGLPAMTLLMHGAVKTHAAQTRLTAESLGLTKAQHLARIALPLSSRAMLSAAVIGLGRAVGDALLPAMLAGNAIRFAKTPLDSLRTLTSHISLVLSSDIGGGEHLSLLLAGALLLLFCAAVSLTARRLSWRKGA